MKRLIKKSALFLLALLVLKLPLVFLYHDELDYRRSSFAARDYNSVFVGSSRTKLAVIPAYFDSLTLGATNSYNFGIEGALPPYTIDECEELIRNKSSLKYVFFELSGDTYYTLPEEPWRNFSIKSYLNVLQHLPAKDFSMYHNLLAVNALKPKISTAYSDYNLSLEEVFEKKDFRTKETFLPEITQQAHRRNLEVENHSAKQSFELNEVYLERIFRLIQIAESKEVKIYFFIPPRLRTDREVETVSSIYRQLDTKYKLGAAHFDESLYREDTSIDEFHLNFFGAALFTKMASEAFRKHEGLSRAKPSD